MKASTFDGSRQGIWGRYRGQKVSEGRRVIQPRSWGHDARVQGCTVYLQSEQNGCGQKKTCTVTMNMRPRCRAETRFFPLNKRTERLCQMSATEAVTNAAQVVAVPAPIHRTAALVVAPRRRTLYKARGRMDHRRACRRKRCFGLRLGNGGIRRDLRIGAKFIQWGRRSTDRRHRGTWSRRRE